MKLAWKRYSWWTRATFVGCLLFSGVSFSVCLAQEKPAPAATRPAPETPPAFRADEIFVPGTQIMPIDMPTALRIAEGGNPTIGVARQRVAEAYARVRQTDLLWIPDLQAGAGYLRHDGEIQNAMGVVFTTNKSSVAATGGAVLQVNSGDVLFAPLVARRLAEAQSAASQAVNNNIQLDVALAYLELLRTYGLLALNTDLLARDMEILRRAKEADRVQLAKSSADINRAETEVQLRTQERIAIKGQVRVASSRLARLLVLEPTVALVPAERTVLPVVLIPEGTDANELVNIGLMSRPELSETRSLVAASETRLRQAHVAPLLPQLQVYYTSGVFGGGQDAVLSNFNGRGDGGAAAVWTLNNFGLGNLATNRVRRLEVGEANLHVAEIQAQVADEVNTAVQIARARREALDSSQEAVRQSLETFRKLYEISIAMTGPKKELDTLEPLLALQSLGQARFQYLNDVVEYNRAQFLLFTALGRPAVEAQPKATPASVAVPTVPTPYQPPK